MQGAYLTILPEMKVFYCIPFPLDAYKFLVHLFNQSLSQDKICSFIAI